MLLAPGKLAAVKMLVRAVADRIVGRDAEGNAGNHAGTAEICWKTLIWSQVAAEAELVRALHPGNRVADSSSPAHCGAAEPVVVVTRQRVGARSANVG